MSLSIIPYKTFACYQIYLETADRIINHHDKRPLYRIHTIQGIIIAAAVNRLYFHLTLNSQTGSYRAFVHADIVFYGFWSGFRSIILLMAVLTSFMIQYQYVRVPRPAIDFCRREFLQPSHPLQAQIQQFAVRLINCFQPFLLVLDIVLLQFHVIFILEVWHYRRRLFTSINGFLDLFLHLVYVFLHDVSFIVWANILIFAASFSLSLLYYLHQLFQANLRHLKRCIAYGFGLQILADFIQRDSENLVRIRFVDLITGPQLIIFLLINCPINAYLIMITLMGELPSSPLSQIAVFLLALAQMLCNFVFHALLARFSKLVHKSAKPLLSLAAAQVGNSKFKTVANLRARILLTLAINRVHTQNRYGIRYGPCGLITLESLCRCILLYGKFLMFSYKIIKNTIK